MEQNPQFEPQIPPANVNNTVPPINQPQPHDPNINLPTIQNPESGILNEQNKSVKDLQQIYDPTEFSYRKWSIREEKTEQPMIIVKIEIMQPLLKDKHHEYPIKGSDEEGEFETFRRYSEFVALRGLLIKRWPGIYIPPIPPKKLWGSKKEAFVQERKHFLHQFLQKLTQIPFIVGSEEMKLFIRGSGDYKKVEKTLPKQIYEDLLYKYANCFKIDINEIDNQTEEDCNMLIRNEAHIQNFMNLLKKLQKMATEAKNMKMTESSLYGQFCLTLNNYEKEQIIEYAEEDKSKLILGKDDHFENFNLLQATAHEIKDPFMKIELWAKEELYEIKANKEALKSLNDLKETRKKLIKKKTSDETTLAKLQQGKTTVMTIFSSKSKKESDMNNLVNNIPLIGKDIENVTVIINIATRFLRDNFLPTFRNRQLKSYYQAIKLFGQGQIEFSSKLASVWTNFVNDPNLSEF